MFMSPYQKYIIIIEKLADSSLKNVLFSIEKEARKLCACASLKQSDFQTVTAAAETCFIVSQNEQ
jgi:hypothetical protein